MKVLHVLVNYHPSVGGTQILYKGISENLVQQYNDEVEVFTVDSYYGSHSKQYKVIEQKQEIVNGVLVRRFPFFRFHKKIFKYLNAIKIKLSRKPSNWLINNIIGPWSPSLNKAICATNADVIVASSATFNYMYYPLYRNKLKNPKPFVFHGSIHFHVNEEENVVGYDTLKAIKASEFYIANTEYEKRRLVELGVDSNMIIVVGTAVDMQQFSNGNRDVFRQKMALKETDILVGYIGRLEKTKSIDVLINAFIEAFEVNKNLKLLIAGYETEYMKTIKQQINSLSEELKKSIFFVNNITEQEKINIYHALDLFVLPSVNESFGIVFLEAWSCKKPVIGVNVGAVASVISNEIDGLLMKPFDKNDLMQKILRLSLDEQLRKSFGENGYQKTKANYTWDIVTKKFRIIYSEAIKKFAKSLKN